MNLIQHGYVSKLKEWPESRLDRIEKKLDILIGALPPRECDENMPPHVHGPTPKDVLPLRPHEQPYATCFSYETDDEGVEVYKNLLTGECDRRWKGSSG